MEKYKITVPVWFTHEELGRLGFIKNEINNMYISETKGFYTRDTYTMPPYQFLNSMECPYLDSLIKGKRYSGHALLTNGGNKEQPIFTSKESILLPRPNSCPPNVEEQFNTYNIIPIISNDAIHSTSPITRPHYGPPIEKDKSESFINPRSFYGQHWTRKKRRHRGYNSKWSNRFKRVDWRVDEDGVVKFHNAIIFDSIKNIDWHHITPIRAGVIIYCRIGNDMYFALGIDIDSGNITDFGGGVKYSEEKNAVVAALREFKEETCGVFGPISEKQIDNCKTVVKGSRIMITFLPLQVDMTHIAGQYQIEKEQALDPELSEIIWINRLDFEQLLSSGKYQNKVLYEPVHDLLGDLYAKNPKFIDLL